MFIPKILHHIWLGKTPMHPLMVEWRERWRALHPAWEHLLWVDDGVTTIHCDNCSLDSRHADSLIKACHLSQRSNIWRYEIVERFGGVYVDTDVEPLKSIDSLIAELDSFVVARAWPVGIVESGAFGASAHHVFTRDLVSGLAERDSSVSLSMGADYFTDIFRRHPEVSVLPSGTFVFEYPKPEPWLGHELGDVCLEGPASVDLASYPDAHAVHRWSSHWFPSSFKPLVGS